MVIVLGLADGPEALCSMLPYVRFGSPADIELGPRHVRFSTESGSCGTPVAMSEPGRSTGFFPSQMAYCITYAAIFEALQQANASSSGSSDKMTR
jgi:hypothetical protein